MRELCPEFGTAALCRVFGIARSTASYRSVRSPKSNISALKRRIPKMLETFINYGVKRMFKEVLRAGVTVTRSEIHRAYVELKLIRKPAKRRVRTTDSEHGFKRWSDLMKGIEVTVPDQVWVADVTGIYMGDKWTYLALVMDVYTRTIVGFGLSRSNDTALTLAALNMGFALGRSPEMHHSDQGSNYASDQYIEALKGRSIDVSMAKAGCPEDNGYAERLNRTIKEENIRIKAYKNLRQASQGISKFVRYYNNKRIHTSISYITPSEALCLYWSQYQS